MNLKTFQEETAREFEKTKFATGGGSSFECSDFEGMYLELKSFIAERERKLLELVREEVKKMGYRANYCSNDFVDGKRIATLLIK